MAIVIWFQRGELGVVCATGEEVILIILSTVQRRSSHVLFVMCNRLSCVQPLYTVCVSYGTVYMTLAAVYMTRLKLKKSSRDPSPTVPGKRPRPQPPRGRHRAARTAAPRPRTRHTAASAGGPQHVYTTPGPCPIQRQRPRRRRPSPPQHAAATRAEANPEANKSVHSLSSTSSHCA